MHPLQELLRTRGGVYSCCSTNEHVLRAVFRKAKERNTIALVEATANQVNQFGGYTGMTPGDLFEYVKRIALHEGFPFARVILGGDHLGPLTWANLPKEEAMLNARELIRAFVSAGFTKIHIDTSMQLKDDTSGQRLSDEVIAARGAELCQVAEEAADSCSKILPPTVYIIGSEVPIPGGAQKAEKTLAITDPADFEHTLETFKEAFAGRGLTGAWKRVVGIVVQPGVEFGDSEVFTYDSDAAKPLTAELRKHENLVFEGHSTDFQSPAALRRMVQDGIKILKVGPALTFALREGLFALEYMERELYPEGLRSHFRETLEQAMIHLPVHWVNHYHGDESALKLARMFSQSDRARYYLPLPEVQNAISILLANLRRGDIPQMLISQYMPLQYAKLRDGQLGGDPEELLVDKVGNTIDDYLYATL